MGVYMCRDPTLLLVYSTHRHVLLVRMMDRVMAMVVAVVVAMVMAWIGHRRIGIRGMRLELCVLGGVGCGGGANVGIVGGVRSHRTVGGALPAVISDRRGRDVEWRKLTRPLGIGGYGS